jgi:hypothetical protein
MTILWEFETRAYVALLSLAREYSNGREESFVSHVYLYVQTKSYILDQQRQRAEKEE